MIMTTIPVNYLKLSEQSLWLDSMDTVMHEIVIVFYIGKGLNDLGPMQINYDSLVSHAIWFTIDCIHETVLLRFNSILCQLEKLSIIALSLLHFFYLVLI